MIKNVFILIVQLLLFLQIIQAQTLDTITICNGDSTYLYNIWQFETGNYIAPNGDITTLIVNPTPTMTGNFLLNGNATQILPNTYQLTPQLLVIRQ